MARDLAQWEPRDLVSMQDVMNRFFDRAFEDWFLRPLAPFGLYGDQQLAMDMYETDNSVVVKTAIPGAKAEDIHISVSGDTLTIKAETQEEKKVERESYLLQERRFGSWRRSVTLPGGLDTDRVEAQYSDGILTLKFPKSEETKPKTIKVKAK